MRASTPVPRSCVPGIIDLTLWRLAAPFVNERNAMGGMAISIQRISDTEISLS